MSLALSFRLAMRDYLHERLLSACSILGLAAVLAPLMVLLGVHHGIISAMTERLLNDPRTLEVIPVGSGKYGPNWFRELESLPETAFAMPQTRSIAATITLRVPGQNTQGAVTPLTASGPGDPLLARAQQPDVGWYGGADAVNTTSASPDAPIASIVLSESTAARLRIRAGDLLEGRVERVRKGKPESAAVALKVASVLPPEAHGTDAAFVPLELLVAAEDFRDGRTVSFLGWDGDSQEEGDTGSLLPQSTSDAAPSALESYAQDVRERREYASFRLYAKGLDDVEPLRLFFRSRNIEVYVKSAEIDTVKSLDRAFTVVFALIAGAAVFGFCASTASNALAGVRRKSRSLGIMRLMGFSRRDMLLFPIAQTAATGFFGSVLAFFLYLAVAVSIDALFAASLPAGETVCSLPPAYIALIFCIVTLLSAGSACAAAWQATTIQPSEVIRDV